MHQSYARKIIRITTIINTEGWDVVRRLNQTIMTTFITTPAILHQGKAYTGKNHARIISDMVLVHNVKPPVRGVQGFMDNQGNFFSREESAKIALKAKQIDKLHYSSTELFSEDLYYDKIITKIRQRKMSRALA